MSLTLDSLPADVFGIVTKTLPAASILALTQTSSRLRALIAHDPLVWSRFGTSSQAAFLDAVTPPPGAFASFYCGRGGYACTQQYVVVLAAAAAADAADATTEADVAADSPPLSPYSRSGSWGLRVAASCAQYAGVEGVAVLIAPSTTSTTTTSSSSSSSSGSSSSGSSSSGSVSNALSRPVLSRLFRAAAAVGLVSIEESVSDVLMHVPRQEVYDDDPLALGLDSVVLWSGVASSMHGAYGCTNVKRGSAQGAEHLRWRFVLLTLMAHAVYGPMFPHLLPPLGPIRGRSDAHLIDELVEATGFEAFARSAAVYRPVSPQDPAPPYDANLVVHPSHNLPAVVDEFVLATCNADAS